MLTREDINDVVSGTLLQWQPDDDASITKNPGSIIFLNGVVAKRGDRILAVVQPILPRLWRDIKSGSVLWAFVEDEKVAVATVSEIFKYT